MLIGTMAKKVVPLKKVVESRPPREEPEPTGKRRNFPKHSLEASLVVAQKIQDEMGGKPMNRLLLAESLGLSPSSSNFREILSSSFKYGLTEGTEKADQVSLSAIGISATSKETMKRLTALRTAALRSPVFGQFFRDYGNKKVPSAEMLPKLLNVSYSVPKDLTSECASLVLANGRFVEIIREIGGSPHILFDTEFSKIDKEDLEATAGNEDENASDSNLGETSAIIRSAEQSPTDVATNAPASRTHKPIFVAHGKNKAPLQQLQALLTSFQIPHKVVIDEANLGRPISQKVRDTLQECGSAILIFTRDEQFVDKNGAEIWRPSENVIYELGATSYLYGDRIVIFKEKGIHFPTNFQNIGYIEFESDDIQARTADLLKELIGFGLVRVTPT
jgi:predicted nucleotide-binding protein